MVSGRRAQLHYHIVYLTTVPRSTSNRLSSNLVEMTEIRILGSLTAIDRNRGRAALSVIQLYSTFIQSYDR